MREFDTQIQDIARNRLLAIEEYFQADAILFYGPIYPGMEKRFREFVEQLRADGSGMSHLAVVLKSPGGDAETVEKLVEIIRHHYSDVTFVVPDEAMSAATVFALSGNRLYMDYSSSLGPIDPQVYNGKEWVPALGYLDQVEKMLEKSREGTLTEAEQVILLNTDLATLARYEQAKNLTITLLKKWLVEYKFSDWKVHGTDADKKGSPVLPEEKRARAEEIAKMLADNRLWHSHGRKIGVGTLTALLRLKVEDYSRDAELTRIVRLYSDFITEYLSRHEIPTFLHSRCYF